MKCLADGLYLLQCLPPYAINAYLMGRLAEAGIPTHFVRVLNERESLVKAMEMALRGPDLKAAQLVAAECVTLAETKDHLNWGLIGELAKNSTGEANTALKEANDQVEPEEDEHLYHTQGWTRELWIETLGMPAVLPPPEETKDVKTAIEAARAKQSRKAKVKTA